MKTDRKLILTILAAAGAGLWLLDLVVIEPLARNWHDQSARIDALSVKVQRGKGLLHREDAIRTQWAEMVRSNLPQEVAAAESRAARAVSHWEGESHITFSGLTQQWQNHEKGYKTLEMRLTADGNQATIGRFIYELETDPAPVNLEEIEITTHDTHGSLLMLTARFSFLQLADTGGKSK
ncbi:MAG: hypothetical protein WCD79_15365 [Chthoniobacteraceae bacterium]